MGKKNQFAGGKLTTVAEFQRLGTKGRQAYWDGIDPEYKSVGSTGKPEVRLVNSDLGEVTLPIDYCAAPGTFTDQQLAEMAKQASTVTSSSPSVEA